MEGLIARTQRSLNACSGPGQKDPGEKRRVNFRCCPPDDYQAVEKRPFLVILNAVKDLEFIILNGFFAFSEHVAPEPSPAREPPRAAVLHFHSKLCPLGHDGSLRTPNSQFWEFFNSLPRAEVTG